MNIYMTGVGGQGIGLLSEVLLRALDYTGQTVRGVDTHGLAQRGGVVVSQIRTGEGEFPPLITPGQADIVLSLERHEALRAADSMLTGGGVLAYYDAVWQPYSVRSGAVSEVTTSQINGYCENRNIKLLRVFEADLPDPRMQNTVLLREVLSHNLIPGLSMDNLVKAYNDLLKGSALQKNLSLLNG